MTDPARSIHRAAIIGAGTMGAGIAALLARAGVQVDLLDLVPDALTPDEIDQGLDHADPRVRNRIAQSSWDRLRASRPVSGLPPEAAERVTVGNVEDDLDRLRQADWIIEAVVEDLSVKRRTMAGIEAARNPESVVSTNTSGLPLRQIAEGRSDAFQRSFLGTHFFNPPLAMKLVEVVPGRQTNPEVVGSMMAFIQGPLAKRVVVCKDTPNFIANRVASVQSSFDMTYVLTHRYTVEEADAILGPTVGRPASALFRLRDLVGLDISTRVAENLYRAIPHDRFRETLMLARLRALRDGMIERGLLGRKTGGGFYREVTSAEGRRFLPLDLETLEYRQPRKIDLPTLAQAEGMQDLDARLRFLVSKIDRVGDLVWASLSNVMAYSAACLPEIADDLYAVDRAMRWGYSWQLGPFETWDALGVPVTLDRMRRDGLHVANWVEQMVHADNDRFYKTIDGLGHAYSPTRKVYLPLADSVRSPHRPWRTPGEACVS